MLARSRKRIDQFKARLEVNESFAPFRHWLHELGEKEIASVEWTWRSAQRPGLHSTALVVSWLGNGSGYVLLTAAFLLTLDKALAPLLVSGAASLLAHLVYPWTKAACGRQRPFEHRGELKPHLASLDKHSFPSGHAMTLTTAFIPMVVAFPAIWPIALLAWLLMAWARIACAHHYPSDIMAGTLLGLLIATPFTLVF